MNACHDVLPLAAGQSLWLVGARLRGWAPLALVCLAAAVSSKMPSKPHVVAQPLSGGRGRQVGWEGVLGRRLGAGAVWHLLWSGLPCRSGLPCHGLRQKALPSRGAPVAAGRCYARWRCIRARAKHTVGQPRLVCVPVGVLSICFCSFYTVFSCSRFVWIMHLVGAVCICLLLTCFFWGRRFHRSSMTALGIFRCDQNISECTTIIYHNNHNIARWNLHSTFLRPVTFLQVFSGKQHRRQGFQSVPPFFDNICFSAEKCVT